MASIEAEFIIPYSNVLYNIYGIIMLFINAYIYKRCLIIHY